MGLLACHLVVDHHEEGREAYLKDHRRSSRVEVDTVARVIAEHVHHDRDTVTVVKDIRASAVNLHVVGMEADCIQDDCTVPGQAAHSCSLDDIHHHGDTSLNLSLRCSALRADLCPCPCSEIGR